MIIMKHLWFGHDYCRTFVDRITEGVCFLYNTVQHLWLVASRGMIIIKHLWIGALMGYAFCTTLYNTCGYWQGGV